VTAPMVWITFPGVAAILLWTIHQRRALSNLLAAAVCLLLSVTAWLVPIDAAMKVGPLTIQIGTTFSILGRRFILIPQDRTFLAFIYLFGMFWFLGAAMITVNRLFAPIGLGLLSLLVAALSVEPFLYAALLIEIAVLLSVPMLVTPSRPVGQGVLRYVIFQTLAVPFILLAGWASAGVEANPSDQSLLVQAVVLLGLGFAFWLAVFPFYAWIPLLVDEVNSYVAGFILSLLTTAVLLLMLDFLNTYSWLRQYPELPNLLRQMGAIMVITGGLWAAFQQSLTRLFGYAVIMENGFALLALSLNNHIGNEVFVAAFLSRLAALALWSLAMTILRQGASPNFEGVSGLLHRYPIASTALVLCCFSIAGLPLLAGFPMRIVLLENLASQSLLSTFWIGLGSSGLLLGGLRSLSALVKGEQSPWKITEGWPQAVLLVGGMAAVVLMGILPGWFVPGLTNLLTAYGHLP
jgi:NADH-quinone oxidoreductase subunit N